MATLAVAFLYELLLRCYKKEKHGGAFYEGEYIDDISRLPD
jgi:hypothetical protein